MKKSYVKPQVYFEDFQLSTSIAAGCKLITNAVFETCPSIIDQETGFSVFSTQGVCTVTPTPGKYDGICKDVPSGDLVAFSSM